MSHQVLTASLLVAMLAGTGFSAPLQIKTSETQSLNSAEQALVDGSRNAISETGISPEYFKAHFTLIRVVDKPSDWRVTWRFSVNSYEALVNDAIGYFSEGTKRVDIHGVLSTLDQTAEIRQTISRERALRIMST